MRVAWSAWSAWYAVICSDLQWSAWYAVICSDLQWFASFSRFAWYSVICSELQRFARFSMNFRTYYYQSISKILYNIFTILDLFIIIIIISASPLITFAYFTHFKNNVQDFQIVKYLRRYLFSRLMTLLLP